MMSRFNILIKSLLILLLASQAYAKETKDIRFNFKNADPVVFSHDLHLLKYNNNCKVCHNAIFNLKQHKRYTMAEMEKTKSCGGCHTGIKAFSVAEEKDCIRCHKGKPRNIPFKMKKATEVVFSHSIHIDKTKGKCKSCHNGKIITGKDKNVSMAEMEKGRTCGACHNGKGAFTVAGNCNRCHKGYIPREVTFSLKGITNAVFSHKFHLGMYQCGDCHTATFPYKAGAQRKTMGQMEQGQSCGTCHNGKDAFSTSGECERCHGGFKPAPITFKNEGGEVNFNHAFHLNLYKCVDCHTKLFPFKAGVKKATMTDMEKGLSCGGCHNDGKDAFSVKANCEKCHKM
ncbi:class III cytochrome C family protein [Geobacter sp. OR-1]|uniref:cytochrome c3 family protein n=1 Tax=Geobacter sp. OR-1 TaxID=1266765 RepID=UPI000544323A|nr:class III cytochrome C family protein [Geobacter sp. OR-1]